LRSRLRGWCGVEARDGVIIVLIVWDFVIVVVNGRR
jgi:hypothetical protein